MENVTVFDEIVLPFQAQLARVARAGLATEIHIFVKGDGLGADKAVLEIGVDDARGLRRERTLRYRPSSRFFRPDGELSDQVQ